MPVKRRTVKAHNHRITPEAVQAYIARDFHALHAALSLRPWMRSPLPLYDCELGCDQGEPPEDDAPGPWRDSWYVARELQAELQAELEAAL